MSRGHSQIAKIEPAGGSTTRRADRAARHDPRADQATIPTRSIYDNFDFDIPRGKLISVFGPNGCGKSTLINMIAGLVADRTPARCCSTGSP